MAIDNKTNDLIFSNTKLYENQYVYQICKRSLDIGLNKEGNSNFDIFDFDFLEKENLNTQHFHFFRESKNRLSFGFDNYDYDNFIYLFQNKHINYDEYIPKVGDRSYIGQECNFNNFSNFGFFGDSKIHCNEEKNNYNVCSTQTFNYDEMQAALEILMSDFLNRKYELTTYNCQSFTKNLLNVLKAVKQQGGPVCVMVSYPEKSTLSRITDSIFNKLHKDDDQWNFMNNSIKWQKQDKNQCSIYQ
ncbi:hypothetical protein [Sulfuricurvum sp.]|uniref:hypothetical protein n=1 Tax=Sulfuricurvum sp. TaxID=2025608 RepID=UPI00260AFE63|nr:hypothetical protein [Sulfuricurvum sp.]